MTLRTGERSARSGTGRSRAGPRPQRAGYGSRIIGAPVPGGTALGDAHIRPWLSVRRDVLGHVGEPAAASWTGASRMLAPQTGGCFQTRHIGYRAFLELPLHLSSKVLHVESEDLLSVVLVNLVR